MASVYPRGGRWYARLKISGRWVCRRLPAEVTTRKRALAEAEDLQARADKGETTPAAAVTVQDLAQRFVLEYSRPRLKDLQRYRDLAQRHLRELVLPYLGPRQAAALRPQDAEQLAAALRCEGKAERTVRLALARLSTLLRWAERQDLVELPEGNPCRGVELGALPKVEDYLRRDEVRRLLAFRPPVDLQELRTWAMVCVVLYEGLRLGEVRILGRGAIDGAAGTLDVRWSWRVGQRPKSGKARLLPLHPRLREVLAQLPEDGELLFPGPGGRAVSERGDASCDALRALCARAGVRVLQPKPWHGLRHTFATHLDAATGGNLVVSQAMLGHARSGASAATQAYLHQQELSYLAGELAKLTYEG